MLQNTYFPYSYCQIKLKILDALQKTNIDSGKWRQGRLGRNLRPEEQHDREFTGFSFYLIYPSLVEISMSTDLCPSAIITTLSINGLN